MTDESCFLRSDLGPPKHALKLSECVRNKFVGPVFPSFHSRQPQFF